jgi:hypothetical protein
LLSEGHDFSRANKVASEGRLPLCRRRGVAFDLLLLRF